MKVAFLPSEVAEMCQVAHNTVLKWIQTGKLAAYTTLGGHYRVRCEDLCDFTRNGILDSSLGLVPRLRFLIIGVDTEFFEQLRCEVYTRWPVSRVENACDEFEIGWWLAFMRPTHIAVNRLSDLEQILQRHGHLVADNDWSEWHLIRLPESCGDDLREWLECNVLAQI